MVLILQSSKLLFDAGGLSDRGYNSMSSEDARRIVAAISCTETADVVPVTDCKADDTGDLQGVFFSLVEILKLCITDKREDCENCSVLYCLPQLYIIEFMLIQTVLQKQ